jgi:hypothetical protein
MKRGARVEAFDEYELLNNALNAVVFDGRFAMRPVYVDLEDNLALEVSAALGIAPAELDDFIGLAVSETLFGPHYDPYHWHAQRLKAWAKIGRSTPPPFIGLLAALSLAAEKMRADSQFSATNYYERLFEVLGVQGVSRQNLLRQYARSTRPLWRELNQWLTEHDFELGRPTARQVNSWKYVSYALSQALVREGDRQRFHLLFAQYDLSPLDDISESEMSLFLHDWMTGTGPNSWLKRLWSNTDLRERVAAAALSELESWDGGDSTGEVRNRRLGWTAVIKSFPTKRFDLLLTTIGAEIDEDIQLEVPAGASKATLASFEACEGRPWLTPAPSGEFSLLEPISGIDIGALMLASFELCSGANASFSHLARPIVPLAKMDTGIYYREVQRTSLLRRHAVLCHEKWVPIVKSHLAKCARPGFALSTWEQLPGLPPEWALFEDVEIVRVLETTNHSLGPLVPLSEGISIQMDGGLRLAPQIWHQAAPPKVLATCDQGAFELQVRVHRGDSDDEIVWSGKSSGGSCEITAKTIKAAKASELSVVTVKGGQESGEKILALRDASLPRPTRGQELAYFPAKDDPISVLNARRIDEPSSERLRVRGMLVEGPRVGVATKIERPSGVFIDHEDQEEVDQPQEEYETRKLEGLSETCVIRGYHYWICEPGYIDDSRWEAKRMDCRDCGLTSYLRNRGKKIWGTQGKPREQTSRPVNAPPVTRGARTTSLDLVFDGLCYLGAGTWHAFQSLTSAHSEEAWFASAFIKDLCDLGHIDVERAPSGRVTSWSVAPPALVVREDGEAYLSGFRNADLVDSVADALEDSECEYVIDPSSEHVRRHAWTNVSLDLALEVLANVRDPFGRPIAVIGVPAAEITKSVSAFSLIVQALAPVHLESKDGLERFDARKGRWSHVASQSEAGAYRTNFAGRRYFIRDEAGECRAASHEVAKIFAARLDAIMLHNYDEKTGCLVGVLGCDLPGLLSRAVTSCSGRLPERDRGRVYHGAVPPAVAQELLSKLYGK